MTEDPIPIVQENRPFPCVDLDRIPLELFTIPDGCELGNYMDLSRALQAAAGEDAAVFEGMLSAEAGKRYTVIRQGARVAIVSGDASTGARDQVQTALDRFVDPARIAKRADLGPGVLLLICAPPASFRFSASPRVRFVLHWLRETAAGVIGGELGVDVDGGMEAAVEARITSGLISGVAVDGNGRLRLRVASRRSAEAAATSSVVVKATPRVAVTKARDALVAAILNGAPPEEVGLPLLTRIAGLAKSACAKALDAVERQCAAELSWRTASSTASSALVDCAVAFSNAGLEAYREALAGNFAKLLALDPGDAHIFRAGFEATLAGEKTVELHLPLVPETSTASRWEALAQAEIQTGPDRRLFAYTVRAQDRVKQKSTYQSTLALAGSLLFPEAASKFTIAFTDQRKVDRSHARALCPVLQAYGFPNDAAAWIDAALQQTGAVEAELALSVPGVGAAAWLRAPGERDPEFFDVYSRVSIAVQRALRTWLPLVYFSDLNRYQELQAAYPLVLYQSTRPFSGRPRGDFTYDVVSIETPGVARGWAARPLAAELRKVDQTLTAAGKRELAKSYRWWDAAEILQKIVRKPRLLNSLLMADTFLVNRLVKLGVKGRELADELPRDPERAVRELTEFAAKFTAAFHRKLRRLYGGKEFVAFGPLLLVEATRALNKALGGGVAISGTLRLKADDREHTFVNTGYRRDAEDKEKVYV